MEVQEAQGKAGFAPDKRAIFVRPMNGHNMGKIVLLVCEFPDMDSAPIGALVQDPIRTGIQWIKGEKCNRTWIVESLGDPIVYAYKDTLITHSVGPVPEYYLAPLDDFMQDDKIWETTGVMTEAPEPLAA